ncbi:MAG: monovalent cation/H+ antiporter subunit D family protein, partial [Hyphomicrobiales bacterium]|nr:monovalent cation/H+ antiporter subunit D family protein [Hyphomicrobiales bacterium]
MIPAQLVILALLIPLVAAVGIGLTHRLPNLREAVTLSAAVALFAVVLLLAGHAADGNWPETGGYELISGLTIAFSVEPLGMLFALVASSLWIVNSIYSIGYMRANNEPRQTPYYACFAIALSSTMGIAFADNLFTLFLFYELLTLSTYPLVTHKA